MKNSSYENGQIGQGSSEASQTHLVSFCYPATVSKYHERCYFPELLAESEGIPRHVRSAFFTAVL